MQRVSCEVSTGWLCANVCVLLSDGGAVLLKSGSGIARQSWQHLTQVTHRDVGQRLQAWPDIEAEASLALWSSQCVPALAALSQFSASLCRWCPAQALPCWAHAFESTSLGRSRFLCVLWHLYLEDQPLL